METFKTDPQGITWIWVDTSYRDDSTGYNFVEEGYWRIYTPPFED